MSHLETMNNSGAVSDFLTLSRVLMSSWGKTSFYIKLFQQPTQPFLKLSFLLAMNFLSIATGCIGALLMSLTGLEATGFNVVNSCQFSSNVEFTGVEGLFLLAGQAVQVSAPAGWSGRISLNPGPSSLAEFTVEQNGKNTMDISLVDGFNVGVSVSYSGGGCIRNGDRVGSAIECRISLEQCPVAYRSGARCVNPNKDATTDYSAAVKSVCPDAYSWSKDDATSTFTCDVGGDYVVTFCP